MFRLGGYQNIYIYTKTITYLQKYGTALFKCFDVKKNDACANQI